ncbi:hypothetical protein E0Z10_g3718 [Xylaria hypoxylon]|uniref:Trichothecene 3-O-acetyltransferase-like N-terminal domain-containing protein n=1 Tax=Xylaria hypoxylon TaxID=37992 RepID=A0A4Z0Z0X0_9PEZI|nr:hypothetical protein E0Z10_g3718 [Xylaria hypoxylon]
MSVKLDVADLSESPGFKERSYVSLREAKMPPNWLDAELLAPCVAGVATTTKIFTGRVNWVEGGCLLAISISHAAFDAQGAFTVIKYWAQLCQNSENLSELRSSPISQSRETKVKTGANPLLIQTMPSPRVAFDNLKLRPELWTFLGLHFEDNLAPATSTHSLPTCIPAAAKAIPGDQTRTRTCIFSFSDRNSAALKAAATPINGKDWISTKDAYTAHIWTSLMRARFIDKDESRLIGELDEETHKLLSSVSVAIDGRTLPGCGFPTSRINNTVYCCQTQLPLSIVLTSDALPTAAGAIRQNIEAMKSNQDLIDDANALAASIPDVGHLSWVFKDFLNRDLVTTSWTDLPFYDLDFGPALGNPEFVRIPRDQFAGLCCMLPRRPNGDIEVIINARENEMGRLFDDTNFLKYTKLVCE